MNDPSHPSSSALPMVASWLELDAAAFAHNLALFRDLVGPGTAVGCVLKGNAYGHGFGPCLAAVHAHADWLYVVTAPEALAIRGWEREVGSLPRRVLVIGPLAPQEAAALAEADVDAVVGDASFQDWLPALSAAARRLRVHVHIDSGLSREGFLPETLASHTRLADPALDVVGVLTHFADVEDVTEQGHALHQLRRFEEGERAVDALLGARERVRHTAASAAALVLPQSRLDVVRVGISAYGLWPSRETRIGTRLMHGALPDLRPVLSWRAPSQLVKRVPAGSFVGYGCTHRCGHDTTIAVLPVGYFDGYPRLLSNLAHVLVRGQRCSVLGRVMMNHIVVDVSGLAEPGERLVATLIGEDTGEQVTADDVAGWAQTINYEITTRLGPHLRRDVV